VKFLPNYSKNVGPEIVTPARTIGSLRSLAIEKIEPARDMGMAPFLRTQAK
jgi:hypothetical protein